MSSGMSAAAGPPSPAGVLRGGFRFQDLLILAAALELLRPASRYERAEFEVRGVENLDDVILRAGDGQHRFGQVKWSTKPAKTLDENYLLARTGSGTSILQKLHRGWGKIAEPGTSPSMRFITNRAIDVADALLGNVDGRSDTLMPFAAHAPAGSTAAQAVDRWADHVGASREQLLDMLANLRFETGKTVTSQLEVVRLALLAAGFDDSDESVSRAVARAGDWVIDGIKTMTAAEVERSLDTLDLRRRPPSAVLSVQAIDADPHAEEADEILDWLGLYDGDEPRARVVPRKQEAWSEMAGQLDAAAARLERRGFTSTLVRGAMRQATFFRVGFALPDTRQHELLYRQGQQMWATSAGKETAEVTVTSIELGHDQDLAVVVAVTLDPSAEVARFITQAAVPVGRLVTVTPARGSDDQAVDSPGRAVALAEAIRNASRQAVAVTGASRVHLFLAGPGGLALLLGHRWNRVAPTTVYEHRGIGLGYAPAFDLHV